MEPWEIEARVAIADLVARYTWNADGLRVDDLVALFADDAEMDLGPGHVLSGREAIRRHFSAPAQSSPYGAGHPVTHVRHRVANLLVEDVSESGASGRCYFEVLTDRGLDQWGRYFDRYVLRDGRWLFAARKVRVDGSIP